MLSDHWVVKTWSSGVDIIEINSPPHLAIGPAYASAQPRANGAVYAVASVCPDKIVHFRGSPDFNGETVDFLFLGR